MKPGIYKTTHDYLYAAVLHATTNSKANLRFNLVGYIFDISNQNQWPCTWDKNGVAKSPWIVNLTQFIHGI